MNPKTQVLIIGAGPTGLSLAVQLLRYNIDFVILEKNEKTTHLSKAIVVQARTLEIFNESGLAKKAIAEGKLTTAMNMFHKGKKIFRVDLAGLGQGLSEFPFALSLEQSKTEKLLVDYLAEKGKFVQWKSEFSTYKIHRRKADAFKKCKAFKLLYFGDKPSSEIKQLNEFSFPVYTYSFTEIPQKLFGSTRDFYILVRPDNHISYIGKEPNRFIEQFASNLV